MSPNCHTLELCIKGDRLSYIFGIKMFSSFLALFLLSIAVECTKYKECSAEEQTEIQTIVNLMGSSTWQDVMKSLDTGRHRLVERLIRNNRIGREYDDLTWVCNGNLLLSTKKCDESIAGLTRSLFGNHVLLCTDTMKDFNYQYCDLVGVMVHEFAHHIGVESARDHNDGANGDSVYNFGDALRDLCVAENRNRELNF